MRSGTDVKGWIGQHFSLQSGSISAEWVRQHRTCRQMLLMQHNVKAQADYLRLLCRLAAFQLDGSGSTLEQAVMGPAASMIQCRSCHHLAMRAWQLAQQWVHMGRGRALPLPLARHLAAFAADEVTSESS